MFKPRSEASIYFELCTAWSLSEVVLSSSRPGHPPAVYFSATSGLPLNAYSSIRSLLSSRALASLSVFHLSSSPAPYNTSMLYKCPTNRNVCNCSLVTCENACKLDESTGYKSGDERSGKIRGTGFLMAAIVHEYQDTKYRRQESSAKAMMISGTMKRRKNAKKRKRSRLEASPTIIWRRQWD